MKIIFSQSKNLIMISILMISVMQFNTYSKSLKYTQNLNFANNTNLNEITQEQAKQIALTDAGILEQNLNSYKIKKDYDDNVLQYEIEFMANGIEYSYDLLTTNGTILKSSYKLKYRNQYNTQNNQKQMTMDDIKQIVKTKIPEVDINSIYVEIDYDDHSLKYEGNVYCNQKGYEFEIDPFGTILEWQVKQYMVQILN